MSQLGHPTMEAYSIQLRQDCVATLWLPKDLRRSEIRKLTKYMRAMAMPEIWIRSDALSREPT